MVTRYYLVSQVAICIFNFWFMHAVLLVHCRVMSTEWYIFLFGGVGEGGLWLSFIRAMLTIISGYCSGVK